jgi:hypothetical protein
MATSAQAQPQLRPRDDPDDPGDPINDHALECLADTRLVSFTATPSVVPPFGGTVTLSWSVGLPTGCSPAVRLNGQTVSASGSRQVQPSVTTRYTLTAALAGLTKTLGGVTVGVDTSACITQAVPESVMRDQVRSSVDELDAAEPRISQRSAARVEVDATGISVALRLKIAIDNFADPNLDIDCKVGLQVRDRGVDAFYRSFAVDLDWPWWVTVVTAGVSKIVEEIIEDKIEAQLKPAVLAGLEERLDAMVDLIPGDLALHSLQLATDEVRVTVCPARSGVGPIVVPPIRIDPDIVLHRS